MDGLAHEISLVLLPCLLYSSYFLVEKWFLLAGLSLLDSGSLKQH